MKLYVIALKITIHWKGSKGDKLRFRFDKRKNIKTYRSCAGQVIGDCLPWKIFKNRIHRAGAAAQLRELFVQGPGLIPSAGGKRTGYSHSSWMVLIQTSLEAIGEASILLEPLHCPLLLPLPASQGIKAQQGCQSKQGAMAVTCGVILPQEWREMTAALCQNNWAVHESRWHKTILWFFLESWWISRLVLEKTKVVTPPQKRLWFQSEDDSDQRQQRCVFLFHPMACPTHSQSLKHTAVSKSEPWTTIGDLWEAHPGTNVMVYTSITETDLAPLLPSSISS